MMFEFYLHVNWEHLKLYYFIYEKIEEDKYHSTALLYERAASQVVLKACKYDVNT